jgi:hypothetical protein
MKLFPRRLDMSLGANDAAKMPRPGLLKPEPDS